MPSEPDNLFGNVARILRQMTSLGAAFYAPFLTLVASASPATFFFRNFGHYFSCFWKTRFYVESGVSCLKTCSGLA